MEPCYCCRDNQCQPGCSCWESCPEICPGEPDYPCKYQLGHRGHHVAYVPKSGVDREKGSYNFKEELDVIWWGE